jgi:glyoxylase-like metal-dependent hydrolase (beta-lactamase superfamily II)
MTVRLGTALIEAIPEHQLRVPLAAFAADDELIARRVAGLPEGFFDAATGTFAFSNHSWVLRIDDLLVLVDPCTGNGRKGRGPHFDDLDTPYLARLADAGAPAEAIDVVFCTHLHHDHCGWNTVRRDGRWVPTFPNAVYLFGEREYQRWDTAVPTVHPNTFNPNVFDECVRPVVEAGQARLVSMPHQVSASLTIEAAPGHTTGHSSLRLASEGATAYFTGDAFHHPVQMARPESHLPGCDDLETAIATRKALVQRALDEHAFVFPAHFPAPHYGRLAMDGTEVAFLPGGAPALERER